MIQRIWAEEDRPTPCEKRPTWELRVGARGVDVCEDHVGTLLHVFLEEPKAFVPVTVLPIEDLSPTCAWPGSVS